MLSPASDTPAVTPSGRLSYANIDKKIDGVSYDKFEVPNLIDFSWTPSAGSSTRGSGSCSTRSAPSRTSPRR